MHEAPTKKDEPDTQNTAPVFDFTVDELRAAFEGIGDRKKPGIDLITKESYAADLEDNLVRGTSDRAYAALLLARRGEASIRERILALMDAANEADFHALALATEALDESR